MRIKDAVIGIAKVSFGVITLSGFCALMEKMDRIENECLILRNEAIDTSGELMLIKFLTESNFETSCEIKDRLNKMRRRKHRKQRRKLEG